MLHRLRTPPAAVLLLASAMLLPGCAYKLQGKVVDGFGSVHVGEPGDPDVQKPPVPGAVVELIRDPDNMNRAKVAQATADQSGRFTLSVEAFGAGWMQEKWVLRARRSGYEGVESEVDLPSSPDGKLLVIGIARGRSKPFTEPASTPGLMDEAKKYEPGIGSSPR
jgi:hypothetical protein